MKIEISLEQLAEQIIDYEVLNAKGSDAFGTVFGATHRKLQKPVNIRILPVSTAEIPGGLTGFNEYFAGCAQYEHPYLTEITDFGETPGGYLYVVTSSCRQTVATAGFSEISEVEKIYRELLEVCGWLHQFEAVHGWINPALIGVDDSGNLKLDGFGLTGLAGVIDPKVNSSLASYLAPESFDQGVNTTIPAEIFSIGSCLYESLTGNPPRGVFQMPSELNQGIEPRFDAAISKALQSDPANRFADTNSFLTVMTGSPHATAGQGKKVPTVATKPSPVVMTRPQAAHAKPLATASSSNPAPSAASRSYQQRKKPPEAKSEFPWLIVGSLVAGAIALLIFGVATSKKKKKPLRVVDRANPEAPTEVWASDTTTSSIVVRWTRSVDDVAIREYKVYRNGKFVGTAKENEYEDTNLVDNVGYTYKIQAIDTSGKESNRTPDFTFRTAASNQDVLLQKLTDLRILYRYCPGLENFIRENEALAFLVFNSGFLDDLLLQNPEFAEIVKSDRFVESVSAIHKMALLPGAVRNNRSGPFFGWTNEPNSAQSATDFLSHYSGDSSGIVSIAGNPETGISLSDSGRVATWGSKSGAIPIEGVVSVDSENGAFAALTKDGQVKVWGNTSVEQASVDPWRNVVRIALGENHILGLTRDFRVLAAGENAHQQTGIPADWLIDNSIISVEAIGNYSFALSADGIVYSWGGLKSPKTEQLSFVKSSPLEMQSTGNYLVIGQQGNGDVTVIHTSGLKSKLQVFADEQENLWLPEISPNGKFRVTLQEKELWKLSGEGIDPAYWESVAKGATDLIIGDGKYLAVIGGPPPKAISGKVALNRTNGETLKFGTVSTVSRY